MHVNHQPWNKTNSTPTKRQKQRKDKDGTLFMIIAIVAGLATLFAGSMAFSFLFPAKKLDYTAQHVVITGGSQGMGKAVAHEFIRRGAHVSILARTQKTLDEALVELKAAVPKGKNQNIRALSVDCTDAVAVSKAIEQLGTPDVLFCCAGSAHPGLFMDMSPEELAAPMTTNYLSAVYCAHAAVKAMLAHPPASNAAVAKQGRKIIFTSSVAAYLNIAGYVSYTPTKVAVRALADTLRLESHLWNQRIDVSCVFPATIYTPGFAVEQTLKPEITKILEGIDEGQQPEEVAAASMRGLDRGRAIISTEWMGEVLRCNMKGPSPKSNILDFFKGWAAAIIMPFIFYDFERKVKQYKRNGYKK